MIAYSDLHWDLASKVTYTMAQCRRCGHSWRVTDGKVPTHCSACNDGKGRGAYSKKELS